MSGYLSRTLDPSEQVLYRARVSLFAFPLRLAIGGWFGVLGLAKIASDFSNAIISLLVAALLFGWVYLLISTTELAITNRRVIAKRGVVSAHSLELLINRVESVQIRQGFFARLFEFGTIIITGTGATHEPFPNISNPLEFRRKLMETQQTELASR